MQILLSEGEAESERWDGSCMEPYMTTVPKSAVWDCSNGLGIALGQHPCRRCLF